MNLNFTSVPQKRIAMATLFLSALAAASGCGREPRSGLPRGDVTIKVVNGDTPVTSGDLDLHNAETREGGGGSLNDEGKVEMKNVVQGTYVATLNPPSPMGAVPGQQQAATPAKKVDIPRKFRSERTSPWRVTVGEKKGEITLNLKD